MDETEESVELEIEQPKVEEKEGTHKSEEQEDIEEEEERDPPVFAGLLLLKSVWRILTFSNCHNNRLHFFVGGSVLYLGRLGLLYIVLLFLYFFEYYR